MPQALDRLTIKGFKSIRSLEDFELRDLNVLIGGNGAGKSNLVDFFRLLRAMMELPLPHLQNSSLKTYIADGGGIDDFLFNGPKVTKYMEAMLRFGPNGYRFKLVRTSDETFTINDEARYYDKGTGGWWEMGSGHTTPKLLEERKEKGVAGDRVSPRMSMMAISSWRIYDHFHRYEPHVPPCVVRTSERTATTCGLMREHCSILLALKRNETKYLCRLDRDRSN